MSKLAINIIRKDIGILLDVARNILLTYPFALVYGDHVFQYGNLSGLYLAFAPLILFVPMVRGENTIS
ncbi:MAG: hypothetical protein CM1200mP6_05360 [Anaerolineaceae bacterium]|nr:MAG: hypothetical protein CM1200mP6_05360 [Anaerolineaceae bacterium]